MGQRSTRQAEVFLETSIILRGPRTTQLKTNRHSYSPLLKSLPNYSSTPYTYPLQFLSNEQSDSMCASHLHINANHFCLTHQSPLAHSDSPLLESFSYLQALPTTSAFTFVPANKTSPELNEVLRAFLGLSSSVAVKGTHLFVQRLADLLTTLDSHRQRHPASRNLVNTFHTHTQVCKYFVRNLTWSIVQRKNAIYTIFSQTRPCQQSPF